MGDRFQKAVSHFRVGTSIANRLLSPDFQNNSLESVLIGWGHQDCISNGRTQDCFTVRRTTATKKSFDVSHFTHAANNLRYDAPHQAGNTAMRKDFSEHSLSGLPSNTQSRGLDGAERAPRPAMELQTLMESQMSSQIFERSNVSRPGPVRSALVVLACNINERLSAFAGRFMDALCRSRQRHAEEVMRRYRHLIDHSKD